ncbi:MULTISPECIES: CehA/McbA family metallohydrolase [Lactobacillales]|uniref:CehA/McbA family metallohydrolase n=1 Tax=Lactobacillales TaxID=186826 RepID=UPI0011ECB085|nr:CehA/McbA family metallohydrolase [Carnobacterium sp. PL17GRE32]KAF3305762.1 PHP domain-containing protein [Carnobacterium sp. PL17GRE32]
MTKLNYVPVELHTHTMHSDGHFKPDELINSSKEFGYQAIVLTDHNTSAPYEEMINHNKDENFLIMRGMEWTTYFGHMLVHGADYDVDWRDALPNTIDSYMEEVKAANGLIGIAHPFDMGSPICTGCHWDFNVSNYELVDYVEVWNSNAPQQKVESELAYHMWLSLLRRGYQISCSTGRDWHAPDSPTANMGVTFIQRDSNFTNTTFKKHLGEGRFYISLGPELIYSIEGKNRSYLIGDRVDTIEEEVFMSFTIVPTQLKALKPFSISDLCLRVINNEEVLFEKTFDGNFTKEIQTTCIIHDIEAGYVRVELTGKFDNVDQARILITNPIYFN